MLNNSKYVLDTIWSLTKSTENAFDQREMSLRQLAIREISPTIEKIKSILSAGPITEETRLNLVKELDWVQTQLSLRKKVRKETAILTTVKTTVKQVQCIILCHESWHKLKALDSKISSRKKVRLRNLINKLEEAIKQKNYTVMKELNEVIQTNFAQLMQTSYNKNSDNTSKTRDSQKNNDGDVIDSDCFTED